MKLADFDFELPEAQIAQRPAAQRDASKLLVLDRSSGAIQHARFADLPAFLERGDLCVFNDTRVLAARLRAAKPSGGAVELLLIEPVDADPRTWRCWMRVRRKPAPGERLQLDGGGQATILARDDRVWTVRLDRDGYTLMEQAGEMPLPPYIRRSAETTVPAGRQLDRERYQTVYASRPGAVAAPTAGLHFTPDLLERLAQRGIARADLTLHVGIGTFEPVTVDDVETHRMHAERYELPAATAQAVESARSRGGRVVAVGTTVTRTLESCAAEDGSLRSGCGHSDLFITPGYTFRMIDTLLTNFHLPRSTLLMLVAAFAGREAVLNAYAEAVAQGYRFFSYGDAMLVRP